jgi:hypothetical protein
MLSARVAFQEGVAMLRAPHFAARIVVLFLASAMSARAQSQFAGRLGIYDDAAMTQASGTMTGPIKSVWVGMPADGSLGGYSPGFEFSISGFDAFTVVIPRYPIAPSVVLGEVAAPPDTTLGTGGVNVAWAQCLPPGQAFLELQLVALDPPQDHVLRVHKRFPPSNPQYPYPLSSTCDAPCFCIYVLRGDSYTLNPTVRAETRSWSAIKDLYRAR